jgi:DNA adenine methylase
VTAVALRPPMPYFGSKQTIAEQIVSLMPEHQHYVEPFAGSLSVLLAKPRTKMETVNDLDDRLMTFWRVLRDQGDELARVCELTPHSRGEYVACRDAAPVDDDVETARRVWVLLTQSRGGASRGKQSGWRYYLDPTSTSIGFPRYLDGYRDRMPPAAARLHGVSLESMPALDLIAKYGACPDVLLYVDPPYLGSLRAGNRYRHELRTDAEHRELGKALRSAAAAVVVSGYPSDLYDRELFADWSRVEIASATGNGGGQRERTEVVWSNRPIGRPDDLFDLFKTDTGSNPSGVDRG